MDSRTYGGATDPSTDDILTGCENVDDSTVVGERGPGISNSGGTNGVGRGCTGGTGVGGVDIGVSSSDLDSDAIKFLHNDA